MTGRGVPYEGNPPPRVPTAPAERRVALVIGNGAYTHAAALDNPVRDAQAMAARLTKLGFDVVKGLDLNLRQIGDVQGAFEDKLRAKPEVALLFYAGHGLQVEGRNYLIPIDAEITQKAHLASRALMFNDVLGDMAENAAASLIFLDACRDNPFTRNLLRSMGDGARYAGVRGGLARIDKVAGTFIAYATAPDQVAYDGKGQNSPFTSALLKHIETPGLSVGDLMIDVRNKVLDETNGRQEPWDQSSLRARFYFVPPEPVAPLPVSGAASEWGAIQATTSLAVLAKFQERFPDPPWCEYAEARARELREADAARRAAEDAERKQAEVEREAAGATRVPPPSPKEPRGGTANEAEGRQRSGGRRSLLPLIAGGAAVLGLAGGVLIWQPWTLLPTPTATTGADAETRKKLEVDRRTEEAAAGPQVAANERPILPPTPAPAPAPSRAGSKAAPQSGETFRDCADCPEMVVVPSGSFMMGSPDSERLRDDDEDDTLGEGGNQRRVTIAKPFAVGKFEVTWAEWEACVAAKRCDNGPVEKAGGDEGWDRGKRPVIKVSWNDAKQYVAWLSEKTDQPYRLLTEAEWEYAARGVTSATARHFVYSWGDKASHEQANYGKDDCCGGLAQGRDKWEHTAPVGQFPANPFGLHDMHGNVSEWVEDCYADSYKGAPTDGSKAPDTKECSRVLRGGSWVSGPRNLRSASRIRIQPGGRINILGFRLARTLNPTP